MDKFLEELEAWVTFGAYVGLVVGTPVGIIVAILHGLGFIG